MSPINNALQEASNDLIREEFSPTIHSQLFQFMFASITVCNYVNTYNPLEKKARLKDAEKMGIITRRFINQQKLQAKRSISKKISHIILVLKELENMISWKIDIDSLDRKIDMVRKIFKAIFEILITNKTIHQVILPKYNNCHEIIPGPIIRIHNELNYQINR